MLPIQFSFLDSLLLTKPPGSIPTGYLRTGQVSPAEADKMEVAPEAKRLQQIVEKPNGQQWNEKQKNAILTAQRFCKGVQIFSFNCLHWILFELQIFITDQIKSLSIKGKQSSSFFDAVSEINEDVIEGSLALDRYLKGSTENLKKGCDLMTAANKKAQKLNLPIKDRLQFLVECLNDKELFPLLLFPLIQLYPKEFSHYGGPYIDAIQKMAVYYPKEAERTLDIVEKRFRDLKKQIAASDTLAAREDLVKKCDEVLSLFLLLKRFWKEIEGNIFENAYLSQYRDFAKQAELKHPLSFEALSKWNEIRKQLKKVLKFDFGLYSAQVGKTVALWEEIVQCLTPYVKKSPNQFKEKKARENYTALIQSFLAIDSSGPTFNFFLRNHSHDMHYAIQSFIQIESDFWGEQAEAFQQLKGIMEKSAHQKAFPFDRLIDSLYRTLAKIEDQQFALNTFHYLTLIFSRLRIYDEQMDIIPQKKKKEALKEIIQVIDKIETREIEELKTFLQVLKTVLGDKSNYYSELFFLLMKCDMQTANDKALDDTFEICLRILYNYLRLDEDLFDSSIAPFLAVSVGEEGDRLIAPLIDLMLAFNKQRVLSDTTLKELYKIGNYEIIGLYLTGYKDWVEVEKRNFYALFDRIFEEAKELNPAVLNHLMKIPSLMIYEHLDFVIFDPTYSLRKWFWPKFLSEQKEKKKEPKAQKLETPSSCTPAEEEREVEKKLPALKTMELINRLGSAAKQKSDGLPLVAKDCLENITIDLLPSVLEIADKEVFSQRVVEKTKLLLEQSLKFALAKQESAYLFEKTNDWKEQQRVASHALLDLFQPLESTFDPQVRPILSYFSSPGDQVRENVGKALVVCEHLLTRQKLEPFLLAPPAPSQAPRIAIPSEIEQSMTRLEAQLVEMRENLTHKEHFYALFVQRVDREEQLRDVIRRQFFMLECLSNLERAHQRLKGALSEATEETPLAYGGELLHAGANFIEHALLMLISYHGIKGEDGGHKIFQKVSSQTQNRMIKYVHHLKTLMEILRAYFEEYFPGQELFDGEMREVVELLQNYNSRTHRYLAQDGSPLGKAFRKLHEETGWQTDIAKEFEAFRQTHAHPILLKAIQTTEKLLKAFPK